MVGLEKLRLLNLQHNLLTHVHSLEPLRRLVFLDLYDNRISDIAGIAGLVSLRVLMLGKNRCVCLCLFVLRLSTAMYNTKMIENRKCVCVHMCVYVSVDHVKLLQCPLVSLSKAEGVKGMNLYMLNQFDAEAPSVGRGTGPPICLDSAGGNFPSPTNGLFGENESHKSPCQQQGFGD